MTTKKGKGVATNMSSEFYVASLLWRLGFDTTITLGHTKEIDIVAIKDNRVITIDVKSTRIGPFLMPINENIIDKKDHYFVFVYYGNKFNDLTVAPRCFVVPASELPKVVKKTENIDRWEINISNLLPYENRWDLLEKQ